MTVPSPNTTFTSDCYVPILQCRAAEREAVALFDDRWLAPLLMVRDLDVMASAITRSWSDRDGVVFIQPSPSRTHQRLDGACSVAALFDRLRARDVQAVPVAVAGQDWNVDAIAGVLRRDDRGVCIRITVDGVACATSRHLTAALEAWMGSLGSSPWDTDLLLDIRRQRSVRASAEVAVQAVNTVCSWAMWRNVVVNIEDQPGTLNGVSTLDAAVQVHRDDFAAYEVMAASHPVRLPIFADLGVRLPMIADAERGPVGAGRARGHLRIANRLPSPQQLHPARRRTESVVYIGTSWAAESAPPQSVHSHLTRATLRHVDGVLSALTDRNRDAATRPARAP